MSYFKIIGLSILLLSSVSDAFCQTNLDRVFPKQKADKRLYINAIKHTAKETTIEIEMKGFDGINLWRPNSLNAFVVMDTFNKKLYNLNKITDIKVGTQGYYEVLLKEFNTTNPIPNNLRYVDPYASYRNYLTDTLTIDSTAYTLADSLAKEAVEEAAEAAEKEIVKDDLLANIYRKIDSVAAINSISIDSVNIIKGKVKKTIDSVENILYGITTEMGNILGNVLDSAFSGFKTSEYLEIDSTINTDSIKIRDSLSVIELAQRDSNSISLKNFEGESIIATLHFDNLQKVSVFNLIEGENNFHIKAGGYFNFYHVNSNNTLNNLYKDAKNGNELKILELATYLKDEARVREALFYYNIVAKKGNAKAYIDMATLQPDSANSYYAKAYELGDNDVFRNMNLYDFKSGELLKFASEKNDIARLYYYKWLNVNGTTEQKDSMLTILDANPIQHEDYYIFMGDRYYEGTGVEVDFIKAEEFYKNAKSLHKKTDGVYDYDLAQIDYRISSLEIIKEQEEKSKNNDIEATLELLGFYAPKTGYYGSDDDSKNYNCEKINFYFKRAQEQIKQAESAEKSIKLYQYLFLEPVTKCMSSESKIKYWEDVKSNKNFMELLKYGNYYGDNHPDIQIGKVYQNELKDSKMAKKHYKMAKKHGSDNIKDVAEELLNNMTNN